MIVSLNIQDEFTAGLIWRLQLAAYTVEANIIGYIHIPPLMDTVESIRNCGEHFYGMYSESEAEGGDLIAAISYEQEGNQVTLCRMMVHPDYFRRGIARKLINHVESLFPNASAFIVSTGSKNEPAVHLYESMGYTASREWMPVLGLSVTEFIKAGKKERSYE